MRINTVSSTKYGLEGGTKIQVQQRWLKSMSMNNALIMPENTIGCRKLNSSEPNE